MKCKFSIIIPFRKRPDDSDSITRLDTAIACFATIQAIEVVVLDTGQHSIWPQLVNGRQKNLCYFHQPDSGVFSPGRVRNWAVEKATGQYIFLFDADLLISHKLLCRLLECIGTLQMQGPQAFCMFPCLYLSRNYSKKFVTGFSQRSLQSELYNDVLESYLRGELSHIDGIALASSCLLIQRAWFMAIGGFREEFAGHGCEDLELIHRLVAFFPIGIRPTDYSQDIKCPFPAQYRGFRRYFSYYALPHLFFSEFLLHQWHPRGLLRKYHRLRIANEVRFAELLRAPLPQLPTPLPGFELSEDIMQLLNVGAVTSDVELSDFLAWIQELQEQSGYPISHYPGLFNYREGVKKMGGFEQKMRKLLLRPREFFADTRFFRSR